MKANEHKLNQRLDNFYLALCSINFFIIIFISGIFFITLNRIIEGYSSRNFFDTITTLPPSPPFKIIVFATLSYCILLGLLLIKKIKTVSFRTSIVLYVLVLICSFLTMYFTSFASNSVLLLVIASFFVYAKNNEKRSAYLIVTVVFYFVSNYTFLSFIPMVSFSEYISIYTSQTQNLLNMIINVLNTLNIIIFIVILIFMVLKEVNESKRIAQLNDELQQLNIQLQAYASIQEKMGETKERNRLAREIHDTLGHTLTGLSMGIEASKTLIDVDPESSKKHLDILSATARQGLTDVRRSVNKLRPDALERHSLKQALAKLIIDFQILSEVDIIFACHMETLIFEPDEEDVIFRIIQEGITNSVRHGHAKKIFVSIALESNNLIIVIEDDGIGCEEIQYGFGLHHMQERVQLLQGTMIVYGEQGFVVMVEIPLRKDLRHD